MKTLQRAVCRFAVFALLSITMNAYAESYIYLTNNTPETLSLNTIQSGHNNISHGDEWEQLKSSVEPYATVKFLRFNRDEGIKWGKKYYFDTTVSGQSTSVTLSQKLKGTMTFSYMWLSAEDDPWHYDRDIHNIPLDFDGRDSTLAYKSSYARASGDDIHYVIHNEWQAETRNDNDTHNLKVMTYNIWDLLPGIEAKNTYDRLATIAEYIDGYDVVIFQEAHDPLSAAWFRHLISEEYPHQTDTPFKIGRVLNGGVFIASRWPIEYSDDIVFSDCIKEDCLASKGAVYARINKGGEHYNVFGAHVRAYTTPEDIANRFQHLAELKEFIDHKNLPSTEAVIVGGDFNVDKLNFPNEYLDLLNVLNVSEPAAIGDYPSTYAGSVNAYADPGFDEYLDYVFVSNEHKSPFYSHNEVLIPRSVESQHWKLWDLSDHFPVGAEFDF